LTRRGDDRAEFFDGALPHFAVPLLLEFGEAGVGNGDAASGGIGG